VSAGGRLVGGVERELAGLVSGRVALSELLERLLEILGPEYGDRVWDYRYCGDLVVDVSRLPVGVRMSVDVAEYREVVRVTLERTRAVN
jgi:hypothetical protein